MQLPERSVCFACGSRRKRIVWTGTRLVLVVCMACQAEWLEGSAPHEQAYSYSDYDTNHLLRSYHIGRSPRFATYLKRLSLGDTGQLLDVGCGTGEFLVAAKNSGWSPTGVELTEHAAALAREESALPVVVGDLTYEDLFAQSQFDVVTLWGVLEHVPDPDALLRACLRVLRPNGLLLLETPNAQGLFRICARQVMAATRGRLQRSFRETLSSGHVVWYSPEGLLKTARRLGLRVEDLRGSRNSTKILLQRFARLRAAERLVFQVVTAALNYSAAPLGRPNQILAALRRVR